MAERHSHPVKDSAGPAIWLAGWMFSIGFLHLTFWRALLGLIIWPYYLGAAVVLK